LTYPEGKAGGIMTIRLVIVGGEETVAEVRERLRDEAEHRSEIDAVLVVDTEGRLVDDVTLFELCIADASQPVAELTGEPWPVTVTPDTDVREVIERLVESRGSSVVVIDPDGHPIGRILADDVIDALVSKRTRLRFPRLPT
jgi:Mg/Co/Ni transporter MgtE